MRSPKVIFRFIVATVLAASVGLIGQSASASTITQASEVQNLRATATTPTSLTIAWDPPASDGGSPIQGSEAASC